MPRLSLSALRWVLVAANLALIGLLGGLAWKFFLNDLDELAQALPNPNRFAVALERRSVTDSRELTEAIQTIYRKPPPPKTVTTKVEKPRELPMQEGGPLAGQWEVAHVRFLTEAESGARLAEATIQTITADKGKGIRSKVKGPRRARTTRSTRPRRPKRATARSRRPSRGRTKHLTAGKEFLVEGETYFCEQVLDDPRRVIYRKGMTKYVLTGPEEVTVLSQSPDGSYLLAGKPLDEDEAAALGLDSDSDEAKGAILLPDRKTMREMRAPVKKDHQKAVLTKPMEGSAKDKKLLEERLKGIPAAQREKILEGMRKRGEWPQKKKQ